MEILVLHNAVPEGAGAAEADVLVQVDVVHAALREEGHAVEVLALATDLGPLIDRLTRRPPDVVFNLVESLGGRDALLPVAAMVVEGSGVPLAGCPAAGLAATNDKPAAKRRLRAAAIRTPDWWVPGEALPSDPAGRWIVKPVAEHGSLGMTDEAVVTLPADRGEAGRTLSAAVAAGEGRTGAACFAERFVDGREFNLSLLAGADAAMDVLQPAEIDFSAFPAEKPRIVGAAAKWAEGTFEFAHTPRVFLDESGESAATRLGAELRRAAAETALLFGLRGWARVDFRVDSAGRPWVLEANANPCLSPDAGFAAALQRAGIPFRQAVARIVEDGLRIGRPRAYRTTAHPHPPAPPLVKGGIPPAASSHHPESPLLKAAIPPQTSTSHPAVAPPGNAGVPAAGSPPLSPPPADIVWRTEVRESDQAAVRDLAAGTGLFTPAEVDIAEELVRERLQRGPASGYHFVFADAPDGAGPLGYACYGLIGCTDAAFDLYWIVVRAGRQGGGLGRRILAEAERLAAEAGASHLYAETSGRPDYAGTRRFYERCGYVVVSDIPDFYRPGDGRVTYRRAVGAG